MKRRLPTDDLPVLIVFDVVAFAAQAMYDEVHDPADFHCLSDPCKYHPYETRIGPRPAYPATLNCPVHTCPASPGDPA